VATSTKDRESQSGTYPSRRAQRYQQRRIRKRHQIIAAVSAVILVVGVALIVTMSGGDGKTETTAPFDGSSLHVVLGDFTIAGDLTAPSGNVRLEAVNQGAIVHNVGIRRGPISGDMQPGGDFTIGLGTLAPGTYQLYCDIVGHVESGMVADLVIT
jgi:manganese oxidase